MSPKLVYLVLVVLCKGFVVNSMKLKQVFILSRHNLRYPLGYEQQKFTPKPWPPPAGPSGHLTPKGALLEGYMGEYFSEWFKKEEFLTEGCPNEATVYVRANTESRTKATARAFIDAAFKGCNVSVHYQKDGESDPLFTLVIHNTTEEYKEMVIKEMNRKLDNNTKLLAGYTELNKILEIERSDICQQEGLCDLTKANNTILYTVGQPVLVNGPLGVAAVVVDTFLMRYYDGAPIEDIAWGQITTLEKWKILVEIIQQVQNILYTTVAEDVASPLVEYLTQTFKNYDNMPKLMLLVGHDVNINTLATALGFQSIALPNQYEKFPMGGKFVFQRWTDGESDYLKVEFVYPSWSQLRSGSKYSLENPLQRVVMRLNWCNTNEQGFCPWKEFIDNL